MLFNASHHRFDQAGALQAAKHQCRCCVQASRQHQIPLTRVQKKKSLSNLQVTSDQLHAGSTMARPASSDQGNGDNQRFHDCPFQQQPSMCWWVY